MNDEDRKEVLGEALMDELKAIREYVQDIPEIKRDVNVLNDKVDELQGDVKAIKAVVTDHSSQIKSNKNRIAQLSQAK